MVSIRYKGCMDWMNNKDWYYIDEEYDRYVLTDKAPEKARQSFNLWKKINGLEWDEDDND